MWLEKLNPFKLFERLDPNDKLFKILRENPPIWWSNLLTVDIATVRKWSLRFAIAAGVFISPFLFAILYSIFTSISGIGNGSVPILDVAVYLIGLLLFIVIPIVIYFSILKNWPQFQMRIQHHKEPWLWRTEWVEGKIPYTRATNAIGLWITLVLFTSIGFGLAYGFTDYADKLGIPPYWLYGAATVVSLWILLGTLLETRRCQKFGISY